MSVTVAFPHYDTAARAYITWRPVPVQIAQEPDGPGAGPLRVIVSGRGSD